MSEHSSPGNGLLPCPFCGDGETHVGVGASQDMVDGEYIEEGRQWSVICGKCGSSCSLYCVSEQAAIKAWNTRVPAQGLTDPVNPVCDVQSLLEIRDFLADIVGGAEMTERSRDAATGFVSIMDAQFKRTWDGSPVPSTERS